VGGELRRPADRLRLDAGGHLFDPGLREFATGHVAVDAPRATALLEALASLRFAARAAGKQIDRWAEGHGLTEGRLQVLLLLYANTGAPIPARGVAEALGVSPANVTGLIAHLARQGLVMRRSVDHDHRSVGLELTVAGRELAGRVLGEAMSGAVRLLDSFGDEELEMFRHLCNKATLGAARVS
jgi:MarR family transcriptional repressor of emrRAB